MSSYSSNFINLGDPESTLYWFTVLCEALGTLFRLQKVKYIVTRFHFHLKFSVPRKSSGNVL